MIALDLFAGSGWGVACQRLGIKEYGVEIMPEAIKTRELNGMETIFNDVWDGLEDETLVPVHDLQIASPPCQTFSMAGHGAGRRALDDVLRLVHDKAYALPGAQLREITKAYGMDDRTALVLTPLAYAYRDRPCFIAWEQVPTVLPVWEACARVLREWGYSVETGFLHAEQYGVPQTRKRAVLVASRVGSAYLPRPTHSKYHTRTPERMDAGVLPWVSMADALGWGAKDQPSHTITAGTHGATDRYASGGSSVRLKLDAKIGTTAWIDKPEKIVCSRTEYSQRFDVEDVATIQTYPTMLRSNYGSGGDPANRGERLTSQPAPTMTSKADRNKWDGMEKMVANEAGALQTFERPFVFAGTKTKQFLQIGNAVPPLLAQRILETFI